MRRFVSFTVSLNQLKIAQIRTSVTVIIHNAWRLDFNLALSSFDSHLRGLRNLIDLALSSPHHSKPRFMFASSISSAQSWGRAKGPFPEEVVYDAGVAIGLGYGASKYVSERVSHELLRGA
jgi:nucleoside-diphosphate-sugar epimerase